MQTSTTVLLFFSFFQVGPNSDTGTLQCLCSHLSAFGGDFLVAPNPIDFDKVWDAFSNIMETKNFLVLGTVCVILGLYIIAAVFARRADRNDSQKVSLIANCGRHVDPCGTIKNPRTVHEKERMISRYCFLI